MRRGDVLLFHSKSKLGRLVREGQRIPGQKYAPAVSHVALVVKSGEPAREPFAEIVEGSDKARRVRLFDKHADDFVWCYRPVMVPEYWLERAVRMVEARVGEPYSFFELPAKGIDNKLFGGRVVVRWATRIIWGANCDGLVAEPFARVGYPISQRAAWACTPADIEALFLANRGAFPCTWSGFPKEYAA